MGITKKDLALAVSHALELPIYHWTDKGYEIVKAIQKAMTDALWRGEKVIIPGFGIFSIRERKATRSPCYYFYGRKEKGLHWEIKDLPSKKYVHFQPAKPLLRYLNGRNESYNPGN